MSEERWGYGEDRDSEAWQGACPSREAAISEGRETFGPAAHFYIVSGRLCDPAEYIPDPEYILDCMGDRAADALGEVAEEWPSPTEEAREELSALLAEWARKRCPMRECWVADGSYELIPALTDATDVVPLGP